MVTWRMRMQPLKQACSTASTGGKHDPADRPFLLVAVWLAWPSIKGLMMVTVQPSHVRSPSAAVDLGHLRSRLNA